MKNNTFQEMVAKRPVGLTPVSREWGFDRGVPIDRRYIEDFLTCHAADVRGHVLEFGDDGYTRRFGGDRVLKCDVLDVAEGNPHATITADLSQGERLPTAAYDCIICTQTLHLIYDLRSAVATLERMLKPGGVLLATVPGITRISQVEWPGSWYWSLTTASARRLFGEAFEPEQLRVTSYGNVLAASAFLYGFAVEEFKPEELDADDPDYEVTVAIRAAKRSALPPRSMTL